ncbi:hypothetical protein DFQ27_000449 [Actinomortierella ambigua]|uniref:Magnesium transport protein CorA n=1 Tax=Actinomortierella ambigua TaxID=1343610 RepID=A0A9P6QGE9_9FUNG|nr:hypothetical protein DFQ27_000449 [Actinomortierella ambigua]
MKRSMTDQYSHLADDTQDYDPSPPFPQQSTLHSSREGSIRSGHMDHERRVAGEERIPLGLPSPPPATAVTVTLPSSSTASTDPLPQQMNHPENHSSNSEGLQRFKRVAQRVIQAQHIANLHHLAVEDMLHVPQRTKVDAYPNQTFVSCTMLSLLEEMDDGERRPVGPYADVEGLDLQRLRYRIPLENLDRYRRQHYRVQESGRPGNLKVLMEQVSMFLLPGGTLLTLFQVSGETMVNPLLDRLSQEGEASMARRHSDSSFLFQAVLDGLVDHAMPIVNAFRREINDREETVLAMPAMKYMRGLHRLSRQLSLLRRTMVPTQTLVATLKKRDERIPLTPLARTYFGDVLDHCNTMVEEIDTMQALCGNLIDLIFNIIAFETNEYMKRLAIVSIIFLPVTFVAGVYGTNFEYFPELKYGIGYFWKICISCTCIVVGTISLIWLRNRVRANRIKHRLAHHDPISIESKNKRFDCS